MSGVIIDMDSYINYTHNHQKKVIDVSIQVSTDTSGDSICVLKSVNMNDLSFKSKLELFASGLTVIHDESTNSIMIQLRIVDYNNNYKRILEHVLSARNLTEVIDTVSNKMPAQSENARVYLYMKIIFIFNIIHACNKSVTTQFPMHIGCNNLSEAITCVTLAQKLFYKLQKRPKITGQNVTVINNKSCASYTSYECGHFVQHPVYGANGFIQYYESEFVPETFITKAPKLAREALIGFINALELPSIKEFINKNELEFHEIWRELDNAAHNLGVTNLFELEDEISILL